MRSTSTKGLTAYVCVGPFAGFGIRSERLAVGVIRRLIVGWVSISVATFDIEQFIGAASRILAQGESGAKE